MEKYLLALGFIAQFLFSGRFLVQWIASERAKRSVVPISFGDQHSESKVYEVD